MRKRRLSYPVLSHRTPLPFASPAEAWFWGMQCLVARAEGARVLADQSDVARPCEPADLLVSVERLVRGGKLAAGHVRTLFRFGRRLAPPDPRCRDEERAAAMWDEALDRLATLWREKGIVV